jgi:hypothetical protein
MGRFKLFTIILAAMAILLISNSSAGIHRAASDTPETPYIGLEQLVSLDRLRQWCEGEIHPIQEYERTFYVVTCDDAKIRITYTPSLVGHPRSGYAAYADSLSPHVIIWYSMWIYDNSAQATIAKLRWKYHIPYYLDPASYKIMPEPNGFFVTAKGEIFGLPYWKRIIQEGNRLAIIHVEAMPALLTPKDVEQLKGRKLSDLNLKPEDEAAAKELFEKASRLIKRHFFEAK